jgi:2-methylcitrate dehydratase PrpD
MLDPKQYTARLADYAAAFRYEQLPVEGIAAARTIVLDTLGALLLGSLPKYSASRLAGDLAKNLGGVPECTVIGRGFKTSLANAALANGVMGYAADVEGGGVCRQHAAAVLPRGSEAGPFAPGGRPRDGLAI